MEMVETGRLHPHPQNPRLGPGKETIAGLTHLMRERGFDEAHPLIVRPLAALPEGHYQIVSGHRRAQAAKAAGLTAVPCSVRPEMTDEEAYRLLREDNMQDGLHPLEQGQHAIASGLSQREYAKLIGISRNSIKPKIEAAEVYAAVKKAISFDEIGDKWRSLASLRRAEPWLWRFWAPKLIADQWTVAVTEEAVERSGRTQEPPDWADAAVVAEGLLRGRVKPEDVAEMFCVVDEIGNHELRERIIGFLRDPPTKTLADAKSVIDNQTFLWRLRTEHKAPAIETPQPVPPIITEAEAEADPAAPAPEDQPDETPDKPRDELKDRINRMDPRALWLWGHLRAFEREGVFQHDARALCEAMTEGQQADVRRLVPIVIEWLETLRNADLSRRDTPPAAE